MSHRLLIGHVLPMLRTLETESINCIVTSPPYWQQRDYKTEHQVWDGDPDCQHVRGDDLSPARKNAPGRDWDPTLGKSPVGRPITNNQKCGCFCQKCGAWKGELGQEPTIELFIQHTVQVFDELYRVLRKDGVLFLNIGDTRHTAGGSRFGITNKNGHSQAGGNGKARRSSRMSQFIEALNCRIKEARVVFLDLQSATLTAERVDVSTHNKRAPEIVFESLLCSQRVGIKERNQDLNKIGDRLAYPTNRGPSILATGLHVVDAPTAKTLVDLMDNTRIVISDRDAESQAELLVIGPIRARPSKDDKATFTVDESTEPCTEGRLDIHSNWNTFSLASSSKGFPDVDLVNQSVSLVNGLVPFACLARDFRITAASEQEVTFTSVDGGTSIRCSDVRHLRFSFQDGSILPFRSIYEQTIGDLHEQSQKSLSGVPNLLLQALKRKGWIHRSSIVWEKPSAMPESAKDRPTESWEPIYMLTKSPRYWSDFSAIREPVTGNAHARGTGVNPKAAADADGSKQNSSFFSSVANLFGEIVNETPALDWGPVNGHAHGPGQERRSKKDRTRERETDHASANHKMGRDAGWRDDPANSVATRNVRNVWRFSNPGTKFKHYAAFPPELPKRCILCGCPPGGTVLDPFVGTGTTMAVAVELGRSAIGIDIDPANAEFVKARLSAVTSCLFAPAEPPKTCQ